MMKKVIQSIFIIFLAAVCLTAISACQDKDKPANDTEKLTWQKQLDFYLAADNTAYDGVPAQKDRPDENGRSWYQVFVYSFCDSNSDGIGDLGGITERLDYIAGTGFDGIWLSPIHPSDTYHKYDVKDYYSIDPVYGSMKDFERLVSVCHERGLKIIIDLVINHTSIDHPWFKAHPEYYNIQDTPGNGNWKQLPGGKYYECRFGDRMPDLNLKSSEVRTELEKVFDFWLDKGVDGFRLDAAGEYESGNAAKNIEILSWLNSTVKAKKSNAYIVGEFWSNTTALYAYYKSGIDSFFAFPFADSVGLIAKTILGVSDINDYLSKLVSSQEAIWENNPNSTAAPFFINHDMARASGVLRRDENLIKMAWGMSIMQPGDAFVYYGEELGMSGSGKDENKRAPMYWTEEKRAMGMTFGPPSMDSVSHSFPPAIKQIADKNSIYSYIKKALILRAKYPVIGRGDIKILDLKSDGKTVGAVSRTWKNESITVIYNISSENATVNVGGKLLDYLSAGGSEPAHDGEKLFLPGYSIAIIQN